MASNNDFISSRLPPGMREEINKIHAAHLTSDSIVTLELWKAFLAAVKAHGVVRFPITIQMAPWVEAAAEDSTPYSTGHSKVDKPPKAPDKAQRSRGDGPRRAVS